MSYGGLDQVLREVAGRFTLCQEAISDTAIHQRLKAGLPWVKALLKEMMGEGAAALIAGYHQEVAMRVRRVGQWDFARWAQGLKVMQERPRRRRLQTLPNRVNPLIATCQAAGMSNI